MKKLAIAAALFAVCALAVGGVVAADALKSGPQKGETVPGPFHPLNVTGADAGQKACLYCKNGDNPVAMIFAREVSEPLVTLIKKVDAATAEHKDASMGSFVVFLSDNDDLSGKLKEVAEKESIKNTVLSIDNPAGPPKYKVAKDADVTVVLYAKHKVVANYAFSKGDLNDKEIERIVGDLPQMLTKE